MLPIVPQIEAETRGTAAQLDPFILLPTEIIVRITEFLDMAEDVTHAMQASRNIKTACGNLFWKQRLFNDMPYLFELRDRASKLRDGGDAIDWLDVYGRMVVQSYPGLWKRRAMNALERSESLAYV